MSNKHDKTLLAILFALGEPVLPSKISSVLELEDEDVRKLLDHLKDELEDEDSPFQILNLDGEYQISTREEYTPIIRQVLNNKRNVMLSTAAFEVLAAIAYNQPVTRGYIEQVRGVDSASIVTSLVEKGLIEEAGRLDLPGKPIAYKTTAHFLRTFGLSAIDELPATTIDEIEEFLPYDMLEGQLGFEGEVTL